MFSKKTHDLMRKLQIIVAAVATGFGVVAASLDLGRVGFIIANIIMGADAAIGYFVQHDGDTYFETREIVDKNMGEE